MVNFPATEEEINRDLHLLGNMNDIKEESSSGSDAEGKKSKYAPSDTTGPISKGSHAGLEEEKIENPHQQNG